MEIIISEKRKSKDDCPIFRSVIHIMPGGLYLDREKRVKRIYEE
jgi:hypothetical protein